ncbi:Trypsin-like peptidase domain-containing protein [Singulisphaera sp. GP187]|uniref:S1 family peptidase n=1 Tax=Singulisphaera sp. GP187 TaxID=1882752 RepID=UPI000929EC68|nr:serine protease [Singulisphaera sp. GP187]SIO43833.1 Trypsin-like peptidase domain-containing protein [Singulisphaera sp. GP187]
MRIKQQARRLGIGLVGCGWIAVAVAMAVAASPAADRPRPEDDWTFRPTVIIRNGNAQGSGSVIASVEGETLILTAAHVVEDQGPLKVELHRYNLGLEHDQAGANWPRSVPAEVVAADESADVAVLRIKGLRPLPYVARLSVQGAEPPRGTVVTSLGIDKGAHLSSWPTRIAQIDRFEIEGTGAERFFLITTRSPEHGRSGGGLFLANGDLVGVCVGRGNFMKGRNSGIFASSSSIRHLLRAHDLDARLVPARASSPTSTTSHRRPAITTTEARPTR